MGEKDVLHVLAETADGAFALDGEGRILLWNLAAERITGRRAADVLGKPCCDVMQGCDPSGNTVCMPGCHIQAMSIRGELPSSYDLLVSHASGKPLCVFLGLVVLLGLVGTIILASLHLWLGAVWLVVAIAATELTGDFALPMVLLKSGLLSAQAPPTS